MLTTLLCAARVSTADFVSGLIVTRGVLEVVELLELLALPELLALFAFSVLLVLLDSLEPLEPPELLELLGFSGPFVTLRTRFLSLFSTAHVSSAVTPMRTLASPTFVFMPSVSRLPPSFLMR